MLPLIFIALKNDKYNNSLFSSWSLTRSNYLLFGLSLLVIIIGYIIMYTGETDSVQATKVSPVILTIGYCVLIPISILYKSKK